MEDAHGEMSGHNRQVSREESDEESASQKTYTEVGLGSIISPGKRRRPRGRGRRLDRNTPEGTMSPASDRSEAVSDLELHKQPDLVKASRALQDVLARGHTHDIPEANEGAKSPVVERSQQATHDDQLTQHLPESDNGSTTSDNVPTVDSPRQNEMSPDQLLKQQVVRKPSVGAMNDVSSGAGRQSGQKEREVLSISVTHDLSDSERPFDQQQPEERQHVQVMLEQQAQKDLKLEELLEKVLAENAKLKIEKELIVKELDAMHERNIGLENGLAKAQTDLSIATNGLTRRLAQKDGLLNIAETALEESQKSAEPLMTAQQRIRDLDKEKSGLEEMVISTNTALRQAQQEHTHYESRIAELQEELDSITASKNDMPQVLKACQEECERVKANMNRCHEQMKKLRMDQHLYDLEQMDFHDRCLPVLLDRIQVNDFRLPMMPSAAEIRPLGDYMASPVDTVPSNRQSMASHVDAPVRHSLPMRVASADKHRPQSSPVTQTFNTRSGSVSNLAWNTDHPNVLLEFTESVDADDQHTGAIADGSEEPSHVSRESSSESTQLRVQNASAQTEAGSVMDSSSLANDASVPPDVLEPLVGRRGVISKTRPGLILETVPKPGVSRTPSAHSVVAEGIGLSVLGALLADADRTDVAASSSAVENPQSPGLRKRSCVSPPQSPRGAVYNATIEDAVASPLHQSNTGNEVVSRTFKAVQPQPFAKGLPQSPRNPPSARSDSLMSMPSRHERPQPSRTHSLGFKRPSMAVVTSDQDRPHSWGSPANRNTPSRVLLVGYDSDGDSALIASSTAIESTSIGKSPEISSTSDTVTNESAQYDCVTTTGHQPPMSLSNNSASTSDEEDFEPTSSYSLNDFGAYPSHSRMSLDSTSQTSESVYRFFSPTENGLVGATVRNRTFGMSIRTVLLFCALIPTLGLLTLCYESISSFHPISLYPTQLSSTLYSPLTVPENVAPSTLEEASVKLSDTASRLVLEAFSLPYTSDHTRPDADQETITSTTEEGSRRAGPFSLHYGQPEHTTRTGPTMVSSAPSRDEPPSISTPDVSAIIADLDPPTAQSLSTGITSPDRSCGDTASRTVETMPYRPSHSIRAYTGPAYWDFIPFIRKWIGVMKSYLVRSLSAPRTYPALGHWDFSPSIRRWIDKIRFEVEVRVIYANGGRYTW